VRTTDSDLRAGRAPANPRAVAVLGLGIMGLPMGRRLAEAGFRVHAWNRSRERSASLNGLDNVTIVPEAASAVADAAIVLVMLSTGAVVDGVLWGDASLAGAAAAMRPGTLVVVSSSIPVECARDQAARLAARGVRYVDAPVSGGERGAIAGNLTIMAGGAPEDVADARPMLETLGRVTHVGPIGAGQLAKLANQLIVGISIGAVAEALLLAQAGGADAAAVAQALQGGFADSTVLRQHGQRMLARSFTPGAHVTTQLKDLSTATDFAQRHGLHLPLLGLATSLYASAATHGLADQDHSALYLEIARAARERALGEPR
jgi:2-hydroxy-3-oxopropionate reductase